MTEFLANREFIEWQPTNTNLVCEGVHIGNGPSALEVVVTRSDYTPTVAEMVQVWDSRKGRRANPILLAVLHNGQVDLCGPSGDSPPVYRELKVDQAERICRAALDKPNRHAVHRFLGEILEQLDSDLVGIRNQGLLSTHELRIGVPRRKDWNQANEKSKSLLSKRSRELITGLGFTMEPLPGQGYLLKDGVRETAIAVFLSEHESFHFPQDRFSGQSPIAYALGKADEKRLSYVIANTENTLRLYVTDPHAGFGSRGRTDTFVELNLNLVSEDDAGYLWLLFSSKALQDSGTLNQIMDSSKDYAVELRNRLRERVYTDVVPHLAQAIFEARNLEDITKQDLDETYRMTLVMLYRLLLVAYAEDEGFLPRNNPRYNDRSLKKKAHELHDILSGGGIFDSDSSSHWEDVNRLFRAVHKGNSEWGLPEYNGKLFSSDANEFPEGHQLAKIELTNDKFGPILGHLLIDRTGEGYTGPVDFRNLGVKEFGEIYEGLLESELSIATHDLGLDTEEGKELYIPVDDHTWAVVKKGQIYLHGASGERKITGTYYTKAMFIKHLLDNSLEPALDHHLNRLNKMSERNAEENLFRFRVADISMGSGHFLVNAIDRIEKRFSSYLTERPLSGVFAELANLRKAANAAFMIKDATPEIENSQLLRRQIARRCIYGVDINPLATELARLSVWVHTFVPGLPLTFLDHNLITGDSVSGVATLDEAAEALGEQEYSLIRFLDGAEVNLEDFREQIAKLGKLADADAKEVREAKETQRVLAESLAEQHALFDIIAGSRINNEIDPSAVDMKKLLWSKELKQARKSLDFTKPIHFPIAFPEVFDGNNHGFDVIIGNPPWEEETIEKDDFWTRYVPNLQGMTQTKREKIIAQMEKQRKDLVALFKKEREEKDKRRQILTSGPFEGMGIGDPDLYKAFCWRFLQLVKNGGYVGVVIPRTVFMAKGSEGFRKYLLSNALIQDLTFLLNNRLWIFPTHPQYTISLLSFQKEKPMDDDLLPMRGPFASEEAFLNGIEGEPHKFTVLNARNWTDTAAFPLLPDDPRALEVFRIMSEQPPLSTRTELKWCVTPHRELDATNDKKDGRTVLMHFIDDPPESFWPILKGGSFDIWVTDTGARYAWADLEVMMQHVQKKRENSFKRAGKRSAFSEMSEEWVMDKKTLPCLKPRIAFRDVTRSTDTRTMRAALVPSHVFLTNKAPYLLWPRGDEKDEAFLLGVLCSIPFDWYVRRFVEISMNFHILNGFPIPRPSRQSNLWKKVVQVAGRLAAIDDRFNKWATAVGVECGLLKEPDKTELINELDAVVAHLYGLSENQLKVVFNTFHRNWNPEERLRKVIEYYKKWKE